MVDPKCELCGGMGWRWVDVYRNGIRTGETSRPCECNTEQLPRWQEVGKQAYADYEASTSNPDRTIADVEREYYEQMQNQPSEYQRLLAENARLKEALAFYADAKNWDRSLIDARDQSLPIEYDRGKRARKALEGIEPK